MTRVHARAEPPYRLNLMIAAPIAALSGLSLLLAFPNELLGGESIWVFGIVGSALSALTLWGQKWQHGLWLGALNGGFFWLPLIDWLTLYLGPIPWLALSSVMILWFALFGSAFGYVSRAFCSALPRAGVPLSALAFAGLVALREGIQANFPYDGFGWGRLAHTQADGPFLNAVAWLGFTGLSAVLALVGGLLATGLVAVWLRDGSTLEQRKSRVALPLLAAIGILAVMFVTPLPALAVADSVRVVGIQGNSKSGVFDDRESGSVIADHIAVTREWLDSDPERADIVVWPENSAEYNLPWNSKNFSDVRALASAADATFVVGSILGEEISGERVFTNSSLVISPQSKSFGRYDKRFPVPFAEYMPNRAFYRAIVPDLVDLVQLDYTPGRTETVLPVASARAGIAICFDIIFDRHASAMSSDGAEIVFAQTNNADFGKTVQSFQQVAIAKLRAVEMGRTVVNISTVAVSEIISPAGTVMERIEPWEPGYMEATVPLVRGSTPAMQYGVWVAAFWMGSGILSLLAARLLGRIFKRS